MTDRKALAVLVLIMTLSTIVVGSLVFAALYQAELNRYRRDLVEAARAQVSALAEQGADARPSEDLADGLPSIHRSLHETGRLLVGRLDQGQLTLTDAVRPPGEAEEVHRDASEPLRDLMRRAIAGAAGTASIAVGGKQMLAAYEPAAGRGLGIVATIDAEEVRAPFVDAAAKAAAASALVIAASALLVLAIGRPILMRARQGDARFRQLFENMRMGAAVFSAVGQGGD
ncbi:MAG: hypothetical protein ACXW25_03565, partial [Rhodospirillales bacterium]